MNYEIKSLSFNSYFIIHTSSLSKYPCSAQELIKSPAAAESEQTDEYADSQSSLQAALPFHDQELGDTGNEKGECHRGYRQLPRIHQTFGLQVIKAGGAIVTPEKP